MKYFKFNLGFNYDAQSFYSLQLSNNLNNNNKLFSTLSFVRNNIKKDSFAKDKKSKQLKIP
jgi:hypothetical protein